MDGYDKRNLYIARTRPWGWLNEKAIYVVNGIGDSPGMITFDFWSQEIYLDANGQITVENLIEISKKQYLDSNMSIPDGIEKVLIETLESLVYELKIVEFSISPITLQPEIDSPIKEN